MYMLFILIVDISGLQLMGDLHQASKRHTG